MMTALIIPGNTETPVSETRDDFAVSGDGQKYFDVPVVEFETEEEFDVIRNYRAVCLPGAKRRDRIAITFSYDRSGKITVDAVDVASKKPLSTELMPYEEPEIEKVTRVAVKPRWLGYALDVSGSMIGEKIQNAKQALTSSARELLALGGDRCRVGVVTFASQARIVCSPTSDIHEIETSIGGISAGGTTAMDDGICQAVELVMAAPAGVNREVVMVTDGMPDPDRRENTLRVAADAKSQGVLLMSLGIGKEQVDLDFLKSLTPISLVIEAGESIGEGLGMLEIMADEVRGTLTDESRA
jgi:uncharacterized protein YegL